VEWRANKLKEEVESLGMAYIWLSQSETDTNNIFKLIKDRCNYVERQNVF
jgi:hypothetical protein